MAATARNRLQPIAVVGMIDRALPLGEAFEGGFGWKPEVSDSFAAQVRCFVKSSFCSAVPPGLAFAGWSFGGVACRCAIEICFSGPSSDFG